MGRLWRITVALTAAAVIAFSSAAYATLWQLWRHPPRLAVERTPDGLKWQGAGYAAALRVRDARMDWLMIWRSAAE